MSYKNFTIKELAQLNQSISSYLELSSLFMSNEPEILAWRDKTEAPKLTWASDEMNWSRISVHCFIQMWGSTSGGWGGIGGAAMTEYYTVAIQNPFGMIAVFWSGRFAYAVEDDEEALKRLHKNDMPSLNALERSGLKVIYKSNRK